MPGSWNTRGRKLIAELKETLRLHFKQVKTFNATSPLYTRSQFVSLQILAEHFGGALFNGLALSHEIRLQWHALTHLIATSFCAQVAGQHILLHAPVTQLVDTHWDTQRHALHANLVPPQAMLQTWQNNVLETPRVQKSDPLTLRNPSLAQAMAVPKLCKPKTSLLASTLNGKTFRFSFHKYALPVMRKPIPPHRFSSQQRNAFRDVLAQKAGLPKHDVQLVSVFDRIYLGLFQSLQPAEDGCLSCVPKSPTELAKSTVNPVSVYLLVGKSIQNPGKTFQAVVPMMETH